MADPTAHRVFEKDALHVPGFPTTHYKFETEKYYDTDNIKLLDTKKPENNESNLIETKDFVEMSKFIPRGIEATTEGNVRTNLAKLQMKLYFTEKELVRARERMAYQKKITANGWAELESKEKALRKNFIHFNKFVRENTEKRARASKKIEDNLSSVRHRQMQIDEFENQIVTMRMIEKCMEENIKQHAKHVEFLRDVVEASGTGRFTTVNDIIGRILELLSAKKMLALRQKEDMDVLENSKQELVNDKTSCSNRHENRSRTLKLIEEKNFIIMGLNNQIANLQARYENANINALESEVLVTQIKNNAVRQLAEIDTTKNSIWNVYVHMASSKKHPIKIKRANVEEQMMYINRTLSELKKVNKLIKKRANKIATK